MEIINVFRSTNRSRGVLRKRCSENMQQIYRRAPMPKCDFNKVAGVLLLLQFFRTPFPRNTSRGLHLHNFFEYSVNSSVLCLYFFLRQIFFKWNHFFCHCNQFKFEIVPIIDKFSFLAFKKKVHFITRTRHWSHLMKD